MARAARTVRHRPCPDTLPAWPGVPPLLARLYRQRGIDDSASLDLSLRHLHAPGLMHAMDAAVARLEQALAREERILVLGDFDADGATSCALAVSALREFGASSVAYLVPNRFEFGYGLTPEILALALQRDPGLIITVDNGISSIAGVAAANAAGVDVLVTDHHLPGDVLPDAAVILNPNQPGCEFPSKNLAGVGVMFYLLMALRARLRDAGFFLRSGREEPHLGNYLDLVALGTVADVVPLDYNNRILVHGGLARIRAGNARPGIAALLQVAGRDAARVSATDLAFAIGPRLNAAGRLDDMSLGIECLLADSVTVALPLAGELDGMNRERQQIERGMEAEALKALEMLQLDSADVPAALVLFDERWHQGVVGILASRIKERFHRPVIAFAGAGDGTLKGSGRSIEGVHLRDLLALVDARHPGLVQRFGGHAMAAGLSLSPDNFDDFAERFTAVAREQTAPAALVAYCETDGSLAAADLSLAQAELLRDAGPWGQHFPEPLFDGEFELLDQRLVGERHLKMRLKHPDARQPIDAIAFRVDTALWPDTKAERVHAVYRMDVNEWRGERSLQLVVEQLQPVR